jgi:putative transposase
MGGQSMKKQRHSVAEVAAKLEAADAMSAQGKLHGEIAKQLGVSVMTYHRWRKARESSQFAVRPPSSAGEAEMNASPTEQSRRISELQLENSRLRRLVTDMLLEKMKLEESVLNRFVDAKSAAGRQSR